MLISPIKLYKSLPRRGKALVLVVTILPIVIAIGLLIFFSILFIGLDGGYSQWRLDAKPKPNFNSADFDLLRRQTTEQFADTFRIVETQKLQSYGTSGSDHCERGQHNLEVHDSYAYVCGLQETQYYGFDGDFVQQVRAIDKAIQAQGWNAGSFDFTKIVTEYYDAYYKGPGSTYTIGNLPGINYSKASLTMGVQWVEQGDTEFTLFANQPNRYYGSSDTYQIDHQINPEQLTAAIFKQHRYAISVALFKDYYSK